VLVQIIGNIAMFVVNLGSVAGVLPFALLQLQ